MASSLRSHVLARRSPALASRSLFHPSCHVAKGPCVSCCFLKEQCLVAPAVSLECVRCIAGEGQQCLQRSCLPLAFDSQGESNDHDGLILTATRRQSKKPALNATPAATEPMEPHVEDLENALEVPSKAVQDTGAPDGVDQTFPMPSVISNPSGQTFPFYGTPIPSAPETGIDAIKQSKTTLWISIPFSTDAVPLKLRSCLTTSSLFDSVFKICGLGDRDRQDKVVGLRTNLYWTGNGGVKKSLMVKRDYEDSFATFLQMIDSSPCWEGGGGGSCSVSVEAVM